MATLQQVVFRLDKEEYGLNIMKVNGIEKYQEVVKVPNAPEYIEGMINLRGEVLPIFSLRKKFNLTDKPHDDDTKIIVVNTNGIKVGFVVDSVEEILQIEEEVIEVAPAIVAGINRKYIKSVAKVDQRMIVLIDIDLVVTDEEKISLGEVIAEA
ncbi:Chemotaxis protein CheW [Petrocella atlantisensis]|uniref:Chemotaxis protein CheW n=1 Tax=Petrocella atlantisensis TaxID=2173034 RepID=A0A3P7PDC4_9FIRM|nr:chemotaxis protein CheW [Petrocella atlantisensis]PKM54969.1 MAG: chemotaxis protein CheW [Firmicutes bacterium HGW-Firmicutes-5]VDN46888.1 Chemotaxis protein CheW [Petrocella atlantisensis]